MRVFVCVLACVCVRTSTLPTPPPRLLGLEFKHPNCLACKIAALFSVHVTCADAFLIPGPNTCYLPHFKAKSPQISLFPAGYKTRFNPYPVYVTKSRRFRRGVGGEGNLFKETFPKVCFLYFLEGRIPKEARGRARSTLSLLSTVGQALPQTARSVLGCASQPAVASPCFFFFY